MTCSYCNKPVTLIPSAAERAQNSNESASYYTKLFPNHAACMIRERSRLSVELMRRIVSEEKSRIVIMVRQQKIKHEKKAN